MDEAQYEAHSTELHRELSGIGESGRIPRVRLRPANIEFGQILYVWGIRMTKVPIDICRDSHKRPTEQKLDVKNDGDVIEQQPIIFAKADHVFRYLVFFDLSAPHLMGLWPHLGSVSSPWSCVVVVADVN